MELSLEKQGQLVFCAGELEIIYLKALPLGELSREARLRGEIIESPLRHVVPP